MNKPFLKILSVGLIFSLITFGNAFCSEEPGMMPMQPTLFAGDESDVLSSQSKRPAIGSRKKAFGRGGGGFKEGMPRPGGQGLMFKAQLEILKLLKSSNADLMSQLEAQIAKMAEFEKKLPQPRSMSVNKALEDEEAA